jgi:membrane associated rhomboid family serine protease
MTDHQCSRYKFLTKSLGGDRVIHFIMLAIFTRQGLHISHSLKRSLLVPQRLQPPSFGRTLINSKRWTSQLQSPSLLPIRPHYYNESNGSLSKALQRQNNPFRKFGRRLNNTSPNVVIWTVIGTNVTVFLMWQYAISSYQQFRDPRWLKFMMKHFVVHQDSLSNGRWHNLLTASISHKDTTHLGVNMLVLYTMGMGVIEAIGASRFLLLYAASGIASSLAHIGYQKYILPKLQNRPLPQTIGSLGASGSVMGITTFFACACKLYIYTKAN